MVVKTSGEEDLSSDHLHKLKKLLVSAEISQRTTDARAIYESKKNIAVFFHGLGNSDMAIKYYKEALDSSKSIISNKDTEVDASQNLGAALEQYGRPSEALEYYEISRKLARDSGNTNADTRSSRNIVNVRVKIAEQLEAADNCNGAIAHYIQCLSIVQESAFDEALAFDLKFRLGKTYRQIGEIDKAIQFLEEYLKRCQDEGDRQKEGPAQAALASCYEASGQPQRAIDHLQQFIIMTEEIPSQRPAIAQASNQLGILYNKTGEFDLAVKFFDKHFSLVRTIANDAPNRKRRVRTHVPANGPPASTSVGLAQIQLGISRGNADMERFFNYVVESSTKSSPSPEAGVLQMDEAEEVNLVEADASSSEESVKRET
ncbi:hypothetical protein BC829DRAFT_426257 [Chytridium lagenaria]|nr:hypothetical protein BC829DRAFT_426257 [Chytridium lagenaria]